MACPHWRCLHFGVLGVIHDHISLLLYCMLVKNGSSWYLAFLRREAICKVVDRPYIGCVGSNLTVTIIKMSAVSMGNEYCGMWWRLLFEFLTNLMCSNGGCWLPLRLSYPYIYQSGRTYSGIIEHPITIHGTDTTSWFVFDVELFILFGSFTCGVMKTVGLLRWW